MTICARNVGVDRGGRPILAGIDLDVRPGELLAVCGPNGAGKSTLLGCLSGELSPDHGRVTLDGESLSSCNLATLAQRRAVLKQRSELSFSFRVWEVVLLGRTPHPSAPSDIERVHSALERVGMADFAERLYPTLSGGEQQRVHLARVLVQLEGGPEGSRFLLLDEPTSALDLAYQDHVLSIAAGLVQEQGYAIVAVLHDLNQAASWADRILLLEQGRRVALGTPEETLTESLIQQTYGVRTHVLTHPDTGRPLVVTARIGDPHGNSRPLRSAQEG